MFLTEEIVNQNNYSYLRNLENYALKPVRYLFDGRTIEILNDEIVKDSPSFDKKSYLGIAFAIAVLIPGLILGVLAKALNIFDKQYAKDKDLTKNFFAKKVDLPTTPENQTFAEYYLDFCHRSAVMNQVQEDEVIWKDKQFIDEFSQLMEDGYRCMKLYFQELYQKHGSDVHSMMKDMIVQPQNRDVAGQDYSYTFFVFTTLYHQARGCAVRLDRQKWKDVMGICDDEMMPLQPKASLTEEDQEPYFNPTKPQYRWRQLYNAFCDFLDKNGLRSQLEGVEGDDRFSKWSRPDLNKVSCYDYPGPQPT